MGRITWSRGAMRARGPIQHRLEYKAGALEEVTSNYVRAEGRRLELPETMASKYRTTPLPRGVTLSRHAAACRLGTVRVPSAHASAFDTQ